MIGAYIHIPFCIHKCYYCDFVSFETNENVKSRYVDAIICEIENAELDEIKTVYIGGGTPSILKSQDIGRILDKLRPKIKENAEITIEANPGTITEEKLKDYIKYGINRISIGLQSTNNQLLKRIGRIHSFEEFLEAYKTARKVGFQNINVDLMLGLSGQTLEDIKDSLDKIIKLKPNHISIYSLIIEEGTKLKQMIERSELIPIDEDIERRMYWETKEMLEDARIYSL